MGKYDKVIPKLPRLPVEQYHDGGPEYQELVEQRKDEIDDRAPVSLARQWWRIRMLEARLEARAKKFRLHRRAIEQLMENVFEGEDLRRVDLEEGPNITVEREPYATVMDKGEFRQWCFDDPDYRNLMSLPWQTRNSLMKERLLAGEDYPPGTEMYSRPKFTLRNAKEKK